MSNLTNAIVPEGFYAMDDGSNFIADLTSRKLSYCSVTAGTDKEKANLFNATNNPDKRIADCINMTINVKHVFVEVVNCTKQDTGEVDVCPRIVLIDDKGVSYQAVSLGMYGALKKLLGSFGEPSTWTKPLPVAIKQITKGEKKLLTFAIDTVAMAVKK